MAWSKSSSGWETHGCRKVRSPLQRCGGPRPLHGRESPGRRAELSGARVERVWRWQEATSPGRSGADADDQRRREIPRLGAYLPWARAALLRPAMHPRPRRLSEGASASDAPVVQSSRIQMEIEMQARSRRTKATARALGG